MKYLHIQFEKFPRIMFSHSCVLKKWDNSVKNNPYFELTYVEEGEYLFDMPPYCNIRGSGGEFLLSPANCSYNVSILGNSMRHSCVAFFFDGDAEIVDAECVTFEKYDNRVMIRNESVYVPLGGFLRPNDHAVGLFRRIIEENRRGVHYSNIKCANLIVELLISLAAAAAEEIDERLGLGQVPSNLYYCNKIDRYLNENYFSPVTMQVVGEYVGLHPNYVSAIYKRQTGSTVMNMLRGIRLENAKRFILMRKYRIRDVAHMVGFDDFNYFSEVFKKWEGVSPSEYLTTLLRRD